MTKSHPSLRHFDWRHPWFASLLLGLAVLFLGPYLMSVFPATGASYNTNFGTPVFAFEFARTPADLLAIFGEGAAKDERIAAMDAGHYLDFVFALLYAGFLASFFLAIRQIVDKPLYRSVAFICVFAGFADIVENIILLGITKNLSDPPLLSYLIVPVQIKFACLTIAGIASSWLLLVAPQVHFGKLLWRVLGLLGLLAMLMVIPGLILPAQFGYLVGTGFTVNWVIVLLYVAKQVWRMATIGD